MMREAIKYVDQHKDQPGWVDSMIKYYTETCYVLAKDENGDFVPTAETWSRLNNYTIELVVSE